MHIFHIICIKDQCCSPTDSLCRLDLYQKKTTKNIPWSKKKKNYIEHNTMTQSPTGGGSIKMDNSKCQHQPCRWNNWVSWSSFPAKRWQKFVFALFIVYYTFKVYIKHIKCDVLPYFILYPPTYYLVFVSKIPTKNQTVRRSLFPATVIDIYRASFWNVWDFTRDWTCGEG